MSRSRIGAWLFILISVVSIVVALVGSYVWVTPMLGETVVVFRGGVPVRALTEKGGVVLPVIENWVSFPTGKLFSSEARPLRAVSSRGVIARRYAYDLVWRVCDARLLATQVPTFDKASVEERVIDPVVLRLLNVSLSNSTLSDSHAPQSGWRVEAVENEVAYKILKDGGICAIGLKISAIADGVGLGY